MERLRCAGGQSARVGRAQLKEETAGGVLCLDALAFGSQGSPPSGQSWQAPTGWQPRSILYTLSPPGAAQMCPGSGARTKASLWALASGLPYRSPGVSGHHGQRRLGLHTLPAAFHPARGEVVLTLGRNSLGAQECMGVLGGVWCVAPSRLHAAPAQARPLPWRRARKAWVGSEGGGGVVGLAACTGEVSSRAERHPGGCSGLQSVESEGGRVLEFPGATLWHQQQKLSNGGGPCAQSLGTEEKVVA